MNENDLNVLNEIYKGNKMGMDAITYMEDKIADNEFKIEVKKQYNDYKQIAEKAENLIKSNNDKLKDTDAKDKIMGWTSVKMNTMINDSTSHLSEMLIQGTMMGVIEGVKLSNKNLSLDNNVRTILDEFIRTNENNIQVLKKYL